MFAIPGILQIGLPVAHWLATPLGRTLGICHVSAECQAAIASPNHAGQLIAANSAGAIMLYVLWVRHL
jgi:hypothetical protein